MSWNEIDALVGSAQTGDRSAFGELVQRFEKLVFTVALGQLHNHADAAELTQDVFLHVMRKLGQLKNPRHLNGWLRRITVRMAINRLTRRSHGSHSDPELVTSLADDCLSPTEQLEKMENTARLRQAMTQLRSPDRAILEAHYFQNQSLIEIGNAWTIPLGTVKRRLHVARHRLRAVLEGRDAPKAGNSRRRKQLMRV